MAFAVLCLDHPEVQAMVGRITDRRMITYGLSPQADARAVNVSFSEGASHFDVVFTLDRRKNVPKRGWDTAQPAHAGRTQCAELPGCHRGGARAGRGGRTHRQGPGRLQGRRPPLLQAGEWPGRRDHRRLRPQSLHKIAACPALPRARPISPGRWWRCWCSRIAATPACATPSEQFAKCLNDADVAIIAPVYAAGEQPILHGRSTRTPTPRALRAHGHRAVLTIDGEADLATAVAPHLRPGSAVVPAWARARSPPGCTLCRKSWRSGRVMMTDVSVHWPCDMPLRRYAALIPMARRFKGSGLVSARRPGPGRNSVPRSR